MNEVKTCDNCGYRKKSWFWQIFSEDECKLSGKSCMSTRTYGGVCGASFENWMPTDYLLRKYNERNNIKKTFSEDDIDNLGKG